MRKRVFFQNAAILTVTSLLLRTIGIFFRIYVSNRVGAEGMGLYQMIVSVYVLMSSFATAGLNTAVTRLCTDALACNNAHRARSLLYRCIGLSTAVGVVSGFLLVCGSEALALHVLHDLRAIPSLRILTVSLPFMGISSCLKGYFLARRRVTSSSISQILEQIVRIAAIVLILQYTAAETVEAACFAVMLGDTIAEAVSCGYMTICYLLDKRHLANDHRPNTESGDLRRICHIALPITAGRYLSSGLRTVENVLVPDTLTQCFGARETALSLFGKLKGMTMPLLFFPSSFLGAFSALLIPELSEAYALGHRHRLQHTVRKALQITLLSSILISGVFLVVAEPLAILVYNDREIGGMLRILAPLAPVMYLESVVVGLLKGLDQQTHSLLYSILDSGSRIALILMLLPHFGMNGFYIVMIASNLLTCSLNLFRLCRVSGVKLCIRRWLVRPIAAVTIGIGLILLLDHTMAIQASDPVMCCLLYGGIVTAVYLALLPALGCIRQEDLAVLRPIKVKKRNG